MADLNKQSLEMWNAMKPMVDREIDQQTKGAVQRRKAKVTTAPSLVTKKIGVTEPFGDQYFIPYDAKVAGANVGDVVWVEYMYGASNAFASMFAKAVEGPRLCSATLSSSGWYRVLDVSPLTSAMAQGALGESMRFDISRRGSSDDAETHTIVYRAVNGGNGRFTDESSQSGSLLVDKIRYTYTSNSAHIDIHYNSSGSNVVTVYFDVNVVPDVQHRFTANSLASVADAPAGETVLKTYTFAADCTPEARVLLWNNWNTSDVSPQTLNIDLSGYKFIDVLFDPFAALRVIQCQRCLVGPSSSVAYTATLQYYYLRTDTTGTASVTAVSRDIDVYSSGIVIGNGQMLDNNTKYNDWASRCRPLQIWGIR